MIARSCPGRVLASTGAPCVMSCDAETDMMVQLRDRLKLDSLD
jgi:hypothetical protein